METITTAERRRRLGRRHHLASPAPSVVSVARDLAGLHATDPASVVLGVRARMGPDFDVSVLESALYDERSLLRILGMRRTMFVVPQRLAAVVDAGCAVDLAPGQHRRVVGWIEELGLAADGDRWVRRVEDATMEALGRLGTATAAELKDEVPELNEVLVFPSTGRGPSGRMGMATRILFLLAVQGRIVRGRPRGSWRSSLYEWAPVDGWIDGGLPSVEPDAAHAELLTAWLGAFGPATLSDAKWWTGWTVRRTRATLASIGAVEVALDGGATGHVLAGDTTATPPPDSWVALVPALDTTVMGWKERDWLLGAHTAKLFDRNGNAGPAIIVDGAVVGGWAHHPSGRIVTELFDDVGRESHRRIADEAERLATWLGEHRIIPRFRTPTERRLSS